MVVLVMKPGIDRHMGEDEIERYSLGCISEEEAAKIEEHLLVCESCQKRVTDSDAYVSAIRSAAAHPSRPWSQQKSRPMFFMRPLPVLAALAVVLVAGAVGLRVTNRQTAAPAFVVGLEATRGAPIEARAPAGRPLALQLDLAGLRAEPSYQVEMVDGQGNQVWKGTVAAQESKATAAVPKTSAGPYFVRVYTVSGELLREYGLEIR